MPPTAHEIKARLDKAVDQEGNVLNMETVLELVSTLEKLSMTTEALEATRIGRIINIMRKKTKNDELSKRLKKLLKKWQTLVNNHLINPKTLKSNSPISFAHSPLPSSASSGNLTNINGSTKKHELLDARPKKDRPSSCTPDLQPSRNSLKRKRTSAENSPLSLRPISSPQFLNSPRAGHSPKVSSSTTNFRPITPKSDNYIENKSTIDSRTVDGEQVSPKNTPKVSDHVSSSHENKNGNINITKSHDTRFQENRITGNNISTTLESHEDISSDKNSRETSQNNNCINESNICNNENIDQHKIILNEIDNKKQENVKNEETRKNNFSIIEDEKLSIDRVTLPENFLNPDSKADGINGTYSSGCDDTSKQDNNNDQEWFGWMESIPKRDNDLLLLPYVILD